MNSAKSPLPAKPSREPTRNYGAANNWNAASGGVFATLPCEVFDDILARLNFLDMWKHQAVNRYWRDRLKYLRSTTRIKEHLHITPINSTDLNPHFHRKDWMRGRPLDVTPIIDKVRYWNNRLAAKEEDWDGYRMRHGYLRSEYKRITGVTEPRIFCDACDTAHDHFRWETFHPLLQPLEQFGICILGSRSNLVILFGDMSLPHAPPDMARICGRLKNLLEYMDVNLRKFRRCSEHTVTQPPCRLFTVADAVLGTVQMDAREDMGSSSKGEGGWVTVRDVGKQLSMAGAQWIERILWTMVPRNLERRWCYKHLPVAERLVVVEWIRLLGLADKIYSMI